MSRLLIILLFLREYDSLELTNTQRMSSWNNLKLHNFFLRWEQPSLHSHGEIMSAKTTDGKLIMQLETGKHGNISLLLPMSKGGDSVVYTVPIPSAHFPIELILSIGSEITISTNRCDLAMHLPLTDVDFRMISPATLVLGSVPHYDDLTMINIGSGNPLLHSCSVYKNLAPAASKEILEHKSKARMLGVYGLNNSSSECDYNDRQHQHGSVFWTEPCVRCICEHGAVTCMFRSNVNCPQLPCPKDKQKLHPTECCSVCADFDYCSVNPCHSDASCSSTEYGAKCRCNEGFYGNGTHCDDIDECSFDSSAREQLGGCGAGSMCVNTRGSFRCDCLPGHPRLDDKNCLGLIRV